MLLLLVLECHILNLEPCLCSESMEVFHVNQVIVMNSHEWIAQSLEGVVTVRLCNFHHFANIVECETLPTKFLQELEIAGRLKMADVIINPIALSVVR